MVRFKIIFSKIKSKVDDQLQTMIDYGKRS